MVLSLAESEPLSLEGYKYLPRRSEAASLSFIISTHALISNVSLLSLPPQYSIIH